jgi:CRISPR/Cas system-associated exonuclease Cas4 (RecB family)
MFQKGISKMNFTERVFERNPLRKAKITSSIGYIYGICARKLWYSINENREGFTEQEINAMDTGTEKHRQIQQMKYPNMIHEKHIDREIPEIYGVNRVGATFDCIDINRVVEIKPIYNRQAYYQTLIEKFVMPKLPIFIYSYVYDKEFLLKTDLKKVIIYIGRILTAMYLKPPRFPNAFYNCNTCKKCIFRERCYSENTGDFDKITSDIHINATLSREQWNLFGPYTNYAINKLADGILPNFKQKVNTL